MQCNPVMTEKRTNSDLRVADLKKKKKRLMENQVNLSCFTPVSVHLELLLTISKLFLCLLHEAPVEGGCLHLLLAKKSLIYQSESEGMQ